MFIYFGTDVRATVTGTAVRTVENCWSCRDPYAYVAERTATATGHAPFGLFQTAAGERARRRAAGQLDKTLAKAVDPVPCPGCGAYQPDMVKAVRAARLGWLGHVAGGLMLAFPIFFVLLMVVTKDFVPGPWWEVVPGGSVVGCLVGAFLPALAALVLRRMLNAGYDPNVREPLADRQWLARRRAWSLAAN